MCVCVCVRASVCVGVHVGGGVCVYVHASVCVDVHVWVGVLCVCACVHRYVCMWVCVCVYVRTHACHREVHFAHQRKVAFLLLLGNCHASLCDCYMEKEQEREVLCMCH